MQNVWYIYILYLKGIHININDTNQNKIVKALISLEDVTNNASASVLFEILKNTKLLEPEIICILVSLGRDGDATENLLFKNI